MPAPRVSTIWASRSTVSVPKPPVCSRSSSRGPKARHREALGEYLKSFDPHIVSLTGSEEEIAAVVKEYRVYVGVEPGNGGDYIVNHSSLYYLMNPDGKFVRVIAGDVSGEELAERLRHWINKTV